MHLLMLIACTDPKVTGDGVVSSDDSEPQEQVWPDQQRVLFYYGSGGRPGGSTGEGGTETASAYIEATYRWPTNRRNDLGEAENFRVVFMMDPGWNGGEFTEGDAASLILALEHGTRVVILSSPETCADGLANTVAAALGAPQRLSGGAASGLRSLAPAGAHPIGEGVSEAVFSDPCVVDLHGATSLFEDEDGSYAATYRPAHGGDVVLMGDYNFMDDTGLSSSGDNLTLLGNLAEVAPDLP